VYDDEPLGTGRLGGWTLDVVTNTAPAATDGAFTGRGDTQLADTLAGLATDVDGDELSFALANAPTNGVAVVNTDGTFRYTPAAGFSGTDRFTYTVDDGAASSSGEVTLTVTDIRGPQATPRLSPAPNAAGWNDRDVTVAWNWTDGGVGIDPVNCPAESTSRGQGSITLSATCADRAGDQSTASHTIRVDTVAPTATITAPASRSYYQRAVVVADYGCADAGSGVARCAATNPDGARIDTATAGRHTFTVTVTDRAGNTDSTITGYTVVARPTCNGRTATIIGSPGGDVLAGTPAADVIVSGGGADRITGGGGNDTICAGAGNDVVTAGAGNDRLGGAAGRDFCAGGPGIDTTTACERTTGIP
jgi:Ca2+-binding RTX toxin-like protein